MIPSRTISAAVAAVLASSSAAIWAAEPTTSELQQEVQQLKAQVADLQARQASDSKDVARTIDSILRDAEQRSQLLAVSGDVSAGYDNGFFIKAGEFMFHPWIQMQFRDVTSYRESAKSTGNSDTENGYEMRRLKFGFDGTLWSKDLTYAFIWATNRAATSANTHDSTGAANGGVTLNDGGTPVLEEGWVRYMLADQWGARLGQFKDPLTHEGLNSSKKLMAAERSYLEDILGLGDNFIQGVSLIYQQDVIHIEVALTDGTKSNNTNFQEPPASSANWGIAGRLEYKAMGDWKAYDDFTAMGARADLLVIGLGGDWTQTGNTDIFLHTVDAQYESPGGLGLYAAYIGRWTRQGDDGIDDTCDWGAMGQISYLLNPQWELFGRYDFTHFDSDLLPDNNEVHELTGGVNYYLHGHAAKLTVDITWLPKGAPIGDGGADILTTPDDHDEVLLRAQFQLVI